MHNDPGVSAPSAEYDATRQTPADLMADGYTTPARADAAEHVLRRWHRDDTHTGYFKTRDVAEALGLTISQTTSVMLELERRDSIARWNSGSASKTTWYLTLPETDTDTETDTTSHD